MNQYSPRSYSVTEVGTVLEIFDEAIYNRTANHIPRPTPSPLNAAPSQTGQDLDPTLYPPVPGVSPTEFRVDQLQGTWTLRFGLFGWAEKDMRGGIGKIEAGGAIFGGDSNYVYQGRLAVQGSEIRGSLTIDRHGADPDFKSTFGSNDSHYEVAIVLEAVTPDRMEGYFERAGFPTVHVAMKRLAANHIPPHADYSAFGALAMGRPGE